MTMTGDEETLRHLLEIVDTEIDEERAARDEDFTAQQALDVRLQGLAGAVRRLTVD